MAKLIEQPITAEDLSEYIESSDDFAFELEVFRLCLGFDSHAEHGGTYADPVSKIDRQFDIRMKIANQKCTVKLAVECKNLKTFFPLLVSRVPRLRQEAFHQCIVSHGNTMALHEYSRGKSIYQKGLPVGKSTVQVGRRTQESSKNAPTSFHAGDDEVYGKWSQAIASGHDLVLHCLPDTPPHFTPQTAPHGTMIIPALVVPDGALWAVDYSDEGASDGPPKRVDECTVFLGKRLNVHRGVWVSDYTFSHLHFFTKSGFETFLKIVDDEDYWEDLLPNFPHAP